MAKSKLPQARKKTASRSDKSLSIQPRARKRYSSVIALAKRKFPDAPETKMPTNLKPMLATLVDAPFTDEGWQFELKLDGYRSLAYIKHGEVELRSRNDNNFNTKFAAIYQALKTWEVDAVVDGEIVVLNEDGVPDFNSIQQWEKKQSGQLVYYVFDLLWLGGIDLTNEPLYQRRALLKEIVPESGSIRFSDHIDGVGEEFFELAKNNNLEGIVAKKKDSVYIPDSRANTWLKIKAESRHEAIIFGYTKKRDSSRPFSSLVLGIYKKGEPVYIGQAGTGFSAALQLELMEKMKPLIRKTCPFSEKPVLSDPVVWLDAELVCEVKYTEMTNEGVMRHASFQGLRKDKSVADLNTEAPAETETIVEEAEENDSLAFSKNNELVVEVDGHSLKLTNLNKLYWPKEKITKGEMLRYYEQVAPYMLPYMINRPQSLNRFPNGVDGHSFYHKNMGGKVDKWLNTFKRYSESNGEAKDFLICTNTASLLYMANLGCIEMNPWHSTAKNPLHPDWSVIDLDPGEISFEKVIETALVVKSILDTLSIPSYPKTSGSTGIHIYIPLGGKYNYEQSKQLAELIANMVHEELPAFTSLVRNPEKRKDKIYIDYLQNRPIQTICAPYSVRPKPGATVSAPLHWSEVKKGLKMSQFHMKNMMQRIQSEGDLFKGVLGKGIDLNSILKGLSSLV